MAEINTWPGWSCVRQLGEGSFGKVYEIEREDFGKTYKAALKVITIPFSQSEVWDAYSEGMDEQNVTRYFQELVENITEEFGLMSEFKGQSNIVSYEDHMILDHKNGIGWDILIRMELLTPLQRWSSEHPMKEADVIELGCDICKALELCWKKKIIHRDIKPENIFVNDNGDYKLGDFGIARTVEKTMTSLSLKGTRAYIAPEVYKGQAYGQRADIYSLGMVLYRFLNENRTPFLPTGSTIRYEDREEAFKRRICGEKIQPPVNGSPLLKEVILKAVSFAPEERYESAEAFHKALERCRGEIGEDTGGTTRQLFSSQPVNLEPPRYTVEYAPPASARKQKRMLVMGLSGVIGFVAVAGIFLLLSGRADDPGPQKLPSIADRMKDNAATTNVQNETKTATTDVQDKTKKSYEGIVIDEGAYSYSILLTDMDDLTRTFQYTLRDQMTLGRSSTCDICIEKDQSISRQHCKIAIEGNQFYLEDLQSTNGTFLNDAMITEKIGITSGDVIQLGDTRLKFEVKDDREHVSEAAYQYLTEQYGQPSANFGFVKDNSYANPILGLGCTFDDDWTLRSYDEIAGTDDNMYDLYAESADGLNNVNVIVYSSKSLEVDMSEYIDTVESALDTIGATNIETEIISLDFVNKSHVAVHAISEIRSIPMYQCQLIYTNTLGKFATITATSFFTDETTNILDLFYSVNGVDDMFHQENNSEEKDTGKNIYELSELQATVSLPEQYYVYSLDNPFTEEMCQGQGATANQITQYLNLDSINMVVVPANEDFWECSFEMDVTIESVEDYSLLADIDNLKDLSNEKFELCAAMLQVGFEASDYEVLETDQAKYIIFERKLSSLEEEYEERIYITIINGDIIYFVGRTGDGLDMTEENYQDLEEFAASLKLNAGIGK